MEKYYLLCVKKTIEQIYRDTCLFIRKLFVFKCSKYTILQLTFKVRQKCNLLLLPCNQERSKQQGYVIVVFVFM